MSAPRLIFASDSFKGTLSSERTAKLLAQAAAEVLPGSTHTAIPMADGGEGTEKALVAACGGKRRKTTIHRSFAPAGYKPRLPQGSATARFGILPDGGAVIEIAAAVGLARFGNHHNLSSSTTYGVGELVLAALKEGCTHITLTLGGSRSNDGGIGMAHALGARFLDEDGAELTPVAESLGAIRSIDLSGLDPRIATTSFTAMCDVDNPLTGRDGATYTFGPQKAGLFDPEPPMEWFLSDEKPVPWDSQRFPWEVLDTLEEGMCNYERVLAQTFGRPIGTVPGAGAAGGLGAACLAFLGAELKPGIDAVLELVGFEDLLEDADLCITGEGRLDSQTAHGKVVSGIAAACARHGVPCVAIAGSVAPGAEDLPGLTAAMPIALGPCKLEDCLDNAEDLYARAARRTFALFRAGWNGSR